VPETAPIGIGHTLAFVVGQLHGVKIVEVVNIESGAIRNGN
jgi:hypothetical protein